MHRISASRAYGPARQLDCSIFSQQHWFVQDSLSLNHGKRLSGLSLFVYISFSFYLTRMSSIIARPGR